MLVGRYGGNRQTAGREHDIIFEEIQNTNGSVNRAVDGSVIQVGTRRCQFRLGSLELGRSIFFGITRPE